MNEFLRIANEYFSAFEGRQHYPKLTSIYWLAWLVTFIFWMASLTKLFDPAWMRGDRAIWLTVTLEVLFFFTYVAISEYKHRARSASLGLNRKATTSELDAFRRAFLCKAFAVPASEFAGLAREGRELMAMSDQLRPKTESTLEGLLQGVHDPDRKARLMSIVIGSLAILVSLIVARLPAEAPSPVEIMTADGVGQTLLLMMGLTVLAFGLWKIACMTWLNLVEILAPWGARLGGDSSFVRVKLNYLMRDLVRFHTPEGAKESRTTAPRPPMLRGKARQQTGIWKRRLVR